MLVACYGTLKKGFHNNILLGKDAEFLGMSSVRAVMYWNGGYPKIYHVDPSVFSENEFRYELEREHELEIYDIRPEQYARIEDMETGAGYDVEDIATPFGVAKIFWMPAHDFSKRDTWIEAFTEDLTN